MLPHCLTFLCLLAGSWMLWGWGSGCATSRDPAVSMTAPLSLCFGRRWVFPQHTQRQPTVCPGGEALSPCGSWEGGVSAHLLPVTEKSASEGGGEHSVTLP